MPLSETENAAILPIVERGVRGKVETPKIAEMVVDKLRELRKIRALTEEEKVELWNSAREMFDRVKEKAAGKAESDALLKKVSEEPVPEMGGKRRSRRRITAKRFCGCVKNAKKGSSKKAEGSAIAVCTSSLLWPHGRTLHSVTCRRKKSLKTQKRSRSKSSS